jgi:hypothetical protein
MKLHDIELAEETCQVFNAIGILPLANAGAIIDALVGAVLARPDSGIIWQDFGARLIDLDKKNLMAEIGKALAAGKPFTPETMAEVARAMGIEVEIAGR